MPPSGEKVRGHAFKKKKDFRFPCGLSCGMQPETRESCVRSKSHNWNLHIRVRSVNNLWCKKYPPQQEETGEWVDAIGHRLKPGNPSSGANLLLFAHTLTQIYARFISSYEISFDLSPSSLWQILKEDCCLCRHLPCFLCKVTEPSSMQEHTETHMHKHTHIGTYTFLILCFGPVGAESHGNQIQRGEESVRCLAELHPSGSHAQTHQSHDKNNIPRLSDSLQGIPVKQRHFSACIPHRIETIWCNVWMWIPLQVHAARDTFLCLCAHVWRFALSLVCHCSYTCMCVHEGDGCLKIFPSEMKYLKSFVLVLQSLIPV